MSSLPPDLALALALSACAFAPRPVAAQPVFRAIDPLPGYAETTVSAVSADGSTVCGAMNTADQASPGVIIRWTFDGGTQSLGGAAGMFTLSAYRISADGSVIIGFAIDSEENLGGFRWTAESGFGIAPHNLALGISDDGAYIVGEDLSDSRPYRWSLQGGYEPIGGSGRATAASADGSIIIGDSGLDVLAYAWRWTSASGRQPLGAIPLGPGWDDSTPAAISADGSVIVGSFAGSIAVPTSLAYRWTEQSGYEVLAHFSEDTASAATAVAADGLTILGYTYSDNEPMTPAIWLPDGSVSHLADFLASRAVNFDGWTLRTVAGISDDGLTIAGNGLNPQGTPQGWVAHLQVPCPSDFNNDFNINSQDFFDFLTAYFAGQPTADINHSGHVNTLDFFDFLAAFFTGC